VTLLEGENVSRGNQVSVETWKLEYVPLDQYCVGKINSPAEPHFMQTDARFLTLILQKTPQSFSQTLQGP
jgi:hypothetical protein